MITKIEALNYRSLRNISHPLKPFQILVGPNASGKTTFLDIISFLSQVISNGVDVAVEERATNFKDLLWQGNGNRFEMAVEARIPEHIIAKLSEQNKNFDTIRFEISIGQEENEPVRILEERVLLKIDKFVEPLQRSLFPESPDFSATLMTKSKGTKNISTTVKKIKNGYDYFTTEFSESMKTKNKKGWMYAFKLGSQKSALGNLPPDETQFPATTWLKNLLTESVQPFILNSLYIRRASPPSKNRGFKPDGSNLPWVIEELRNNNREKFDEWIAHIQTALPDIESIRTIEREDDKHRYLLVKYKSGLEIPSWVVSDGTLRLLALTLPAYLDLKGGIYLIEEPENGIHPRAIETVYQSLSSVYDAQILMATHSPVLLGISDAENILCFAKTQDGITDIVAGNLHPALKKWQGETTLGELFAAGVLG